MSTNLANLLHTRTDSSFEHDLWDVYDYLSLLSFSKELREEVDRYQREAYGRSLVADAVFALNGCTPKEGSPIAGAWFEVIGSPRFSKLQRMCKDRMAYASVVMQLASMVERMLQETEPETEPVSVGLECPSCGATGEATVLPDILGDVRGTLCPSCEEGMATIVGLDGEEGEGAGLLAVVPSNLDEQLEETEAEATLVSTLGAYMTGSPSKRFEQALDLTDEFDLKAFTRFLGWAKMVIGGASRETRGGTDEMTGYNSGQWSDKVVPHQMLAVAEGDLGALASLADNSLIRRQFNANRPMGRGPAILMRDESGSMGPECHPPFARHKTALAFELALAEAFNREGRDLVSLAWSSKGTRAHTYGEEGLRKHLTSFLNGGTDIGKPLEEAIGITGRYALNADVLILTDGQLHRSSTTLRTILDTIEPFRKEGGRVWAVSLVTADERLDWTDGCVNLSELEPGDDLAEVLRGIIRSDDNRKRRL